MCEYPSFILRPGLIVNWTETDSHETCIARLGLDDSRNHHRTFLRAEGHGNDFRIDESLDNLPSWYADHEQEYRDKCAVIFKKINPIRKKLDAVNAKWQTELDAVYAKWMPERDVVYAKWLPELDVVYAKRQTEIDAMYAKWLPELDAVNAKWQPERDVLIKIYSRVEGFVPAAKDETRKSR